MYCLFDNRPLIKHLLETPFIDCGTKSWIKTLRKNMVIITWCYSQYDPNHTIKTAKSFHLNLSYMIILAIIREITQFNG